MFIGDYVDRGPSTRELLDDLLRLRRRLPGAAFDIWMRNGGDATLESYGIRGEALHRLLSMGFERERIHEIFSHIPRGHLQFLSALNLFLETEDHFFCHAGVDPSLSIQQGKQKPRCGHRTVRRRSPDRMRRAQRQGVSNVTEKKTGDALPGDDDTFTLFPRVSGFQGVIRFRSLGKREVSRTLASPSIWAVTRSRPMARPPWGGTP